LSGSLLAMAMALLSLNLPQLFFEPFPLWYRVADQVLLVTGFLGSAIRSKTLRFAGWIGICLFITYALIGSAPSLDHPAFGPNGEQRPELWMLRAAFWVALSVVLVVCFRKLAVKSKVR
jgi:hypothetical protein